MEISALMGQIYDLFSRYTADIKNMDVMDVKKAKKEYGFRFLKDGEFICIRYKDPETGVWMANRLQTNTNDEILACTIAVAKRDEIVKKHKDKKAKKNSKKRGEALHEMLLSYYAEGSAYLKKDEANGRRLPATNQRAKFKGFFKNYLIPFLAEREINSLQEVTPSIYTDLKVHLRGQTSNRGKNKGEGLSVKTINNLLSGFVRVLEHHEREGIIKVPYRPKEALLYKTDQDKARAEKNQVDILPTDKLQGILLFLWERTCIKILKGQTSRKPDLMAYTLIAFLGLSCGLRNSEIGRIKVGDIHRIKEIEDAFFIRIWNVKTKNFHKGKGDAFRKVPIHPYIAQYLHTFIIERRKKRDDYLFGNPDTGRAKESLNAKWYRNAIDELFEALKAVEKLRAGDIRGAYNIEGTDTGTLFRERKGEKNIDFYSLRHTLHTLFVARHDEKGMLVDYFCGHKPEAEMRANYTHINQIDNVTFWKEYGRHLVGVQEIFVTTGKKYSGNEKDDEFRKRFFAYKMYYIKDLGLDEYGTRLRWPGPNSPELFQGFFENWIHHVEEGIPYQYPQKDEKRKDAGLEWENDDVFTAV